MYFSSWNEEGTKNGFTSDPEIRSGQVRARITVAMPCTTETMKPRRPSSVRKHSHERGTAK